MTALDRTHNPAAVSWVASAKDHPDFPVQNLPLGVVHHGGKDVIATAIGEEIFLFPTGIEYGWGSALSDALKAAVHAPTLNAIAALPPHEWTQLRHSLFDLLVNPARQEWFRPVLTPRDSVPARLPFAVGDYTDFYASIYHATNVGSMFRPDNPLLPNYKWVPIGYHGRASSLVVSGEKIRRPVGQTRPADATEVSFGPSRSLDYELELGFFLGGANPLGTPLTADEAADRLFGCVLLNDWSARDMQAWEYQPLGPFLAKSFATTISTWVVTADALRPFRVAMPARPEGDPAPLPYLRTSGGDQTYQIDLEVILRSESMRRKHVKATPLTRVNYAEAMYWSPAQFITHHASNGCNLRPGDLLGSGTISGPDVDARGCLLERTWRGRDPIELPTGETRTFLSDGDEVVFQGHCHAQGAATIGFGGCRGVILPA